MKVFLVICLIGLGGASYYFVSRVSDATEALKITGPDAGNSNDQLLACTAAQLTIKERVTTSAAIFPFCSGVPVVGSGPRFVVSSFFDLPDSSGIKRRHNFTVNVEDRANGFISKLD